MLISQLTKNGLRTVQAAGNEDTDIVAYALHTARTSLVLTASGMFADQDTNILVLLLHHHRPHMHDIYFIFCIRNPELNLSLMKGSESNAFDWTSGHNQPVKVL